MDETTLTGEHARRVPDPSVEGPLDRSAAVALLRRADELLDQGDFGEAGRYYQRVIGFPEASLTAAALLGLGTALYRLDHEAEALSAWEQVLQLPETPATYLAWRQVAAARVRAGDLGDAIKAYREADRRAPLQDKPEIASRLGWLAKETGDTGAARRHFARARGATMPVLTFAIIGITVVVSLTAWVDPNRDVPGSLLSQLALDKRALAMGEYWRLLSVTLVHAGYLHLFFNMYALYFAGQLVEQMYGSVMFGLFYVLAAVAASVASFVMGPETAVGASGAVFGLFGVLLAVSRTHHPLLDRRGQMIMGQIGTLIVINLFIGFAIPGIDNSAHIGGLLAGVWLGFLLPPGKVETLTSLWQQPGGVPREVARGSAVLRLAGVLALVVVILVALSIKSDASRGSSGGDSTASLVSSASSLNRA